MDSDNGSKDESIVTESDEEDSFALTLSSVRIQITRIVRTAEI